jgi:RNA polymerase sigma factor (sigma-70 family)
MRAQKISEAFIRRQSRVMLKSVIRWVRNWEDAREIVQECWLKFFANGMQDKYPDDVPYEAVLFRILKFETCNFIRKRSRRGKKLIFNSELLDRAPPGRGDRVQEKALISRDRKARILKQLDNHRNRLNPIERGTIKQTLANRKNGEIARDLKTSAETVSKKKYTAKIKLMASLKREKGKSA